MPNNKTLEVNTIPYGTLKTYDLRRVSRHTDPLEYIEVLKNSLVKSVTHVSEPVNKEIKKCAYDWFYESGRIRKGGWKNIDNYF